MAAYEWPTTWPIGSYDRAPQHHALRQADTGKLRYGLGYNAEDTPIFGWRPFKNHEPFGLLTQSPAPSTSIDTIFYHKRIGNVEEYVLQFPLNVSNQPAPINLKRNTPGPHPDGMLRTPILNGQPSNAPLTLYAGNNWEGYQEPPAGGDKYPLGLSGEAPDFETPFEMQDVNGGENPLGTNDARLLASLVLSIILMRRDHRLDVPNPHNVASEFHQQGVPQFLFRTPAGLGAPNRAELNNWMDSLPRLNKLINNVHGGQIWRRLPHHYPLARDIHSQVNVEIIQDVDSLGDDEYPNDQFESRRLDSPVSLATHDGYAKLWYRIIEMCEEIFNMYRGGARGDDDDDERRYVFVTGIKIQIHHFPAPAGMGGCLPSSNRVKRGREVIINDLKYFSPVSSNNNCLMACMNHARSVFKLPKKDVGTGRSIYTLARFRAHLRENEPVAYNDGASIIALANYFGINVEIRDIYSKILFKHDPLPGVGHTAIITYHEEEKDKNGHYYYSKGKSVQETYCDVCGTLFKSKHNCNANKVRYVNRVLKKRHPMPLASNLLVINNPSKGRIQPCASEDYIVFDLETFPDENGKATTYAAGLYHQDNYLEWFGSGALSSLLLHLISLEERTVMDPKSNKPVARPYFVMAWNGAGFDFHLILNFFLSYFSRVNNICSIEKMVYHGNKLLSFEIRKKNYLTTPKKNDPLGYYGCKTAKSPPFLIFMDPNRFISSSLDTACKSFLSSSDVHKDRFPHKLMRSFQDLHRFFSIDQLNDPSNYFDRDLKSIKKDPWTEEELKPYYTHQGYSLFLMAQCYLKKDVLSMHAVVKKFFDQLRDVLDGMHPEYFITISQLSMSAWYETSPYVDRIFLPTSSFEYDFIRAAVYGGKVFPIKQEFVSSDLPWLYRDNIHKQAKFHFSFQEMSSWKHGQTVENVFGLEYDQVTDYLIEGDVTSLYPAAMKFFSYPTGNPKFFSEKEDIQKIQDAVFDHGKFPIGIYEVTIIPNKNLVNPVLPSHGAKTEGLQWDLFDKTGVWTHIDLNQALECGYEVIRIHRAMQWPSQDPVFRDYIEKAYEIKQRGEDQKNPAMRQSGKILLNSLYGKMLQAVMETSEAICTTSDEMDSFLENHNWHFSRSLEDSGFELIIGSKKERKFTKPNYLGAYILSYSRKIMLSYYKKADPYFGSRNYKLSLKNSPYYGDTDSMYIHSDVAQRMEFSNQLGGLKREDYGKILVAYFLNKKTYALLYINQKNELKVGLHNKGIAINKLNFAHFAQATDIPTYTEVINMGVSLKKCGIRPKNMTDLLSIKSVKLERTFNKTSFYSRIHVHPETLQPAWFSPITLPLGHAKHPAKWQTEKEYAHDLENIKEELENYYREESAEQYSDFSD